MRVNHTVVGLLCLVQIWRLNDSRKSSLLHVLEDDVIAGERHSEKIFSWIFHRRNYDELFVLKTNIEAELCERFTALGHVDLDLRIPEDNLGVHWDICDGLLRTFTMVDDLRKVWMSESIDTHKNPYRTDGGGFTICRLEGQRYAILDSNLETKTSRQ